MFVPTLTFFGIMACTNKRVSFFGLFEMKVAEVSGKKVVISNRFTD